MCLYTLVQHGDSLEQECYPLFLQGEFPTYEIFWQRHVVPLTNRPTDITFKNNIELSAIGKCENDVCIAQLHYSILNHLHCVYKLRIQANLVFDQVMEGILRLDGARDVAFDLLERFSDPAKYGAWINNARTEPLGSKQAQNNWLVKTHPPFNDIHHYRNILVHGRALPTLNVNGINYLPDIDKVEKYFDWRLITNNANFETILALDFKTTNQLLDNCWSRTIQYFDTQWQLLI